MTRCVIQRDDGVRHDIAGRVFASYVELILHSVALLTLPAESAHVLRRTQRASKQLAEDRAFAPSASSCSLQDMGNHLANLLIGIEAHQLDLWVGQRKDPKDFVGEGLADQDDTLEIENHGAELLETDNQTLGLRPGHEIIIAILSQAYRDHRFGEAEVVTTGEPFEHLAD
jgi:hypothetical protein